MTPIDKTKSSADIKKEVLGTGAHKLQRALEEVKNEDGGNEHKTVQAKYKTLKTEKAEEKIEKPVGTEVGKLAAKEVKEATRQVEFTQEALINHIKTLDIPEIPVARRLELIKKYKVVVWKRQLHKKPEVHERLREKKIARAARMSKSKKWKGEYFYDEGTGNILKVGKTYDMIKADPYMIMFKFPWSRRRKNKNVLLEKICLRSGFGLRVLAAADDAYQDSLKIKNKYKRRKYLMNRAGGEASTRSNERQEKARWKFLRGLAGIAGKPYKSGGHQAGIGLDLNYWGVFVPYMKKYGLTGGFWNGIPNDPCHFDARKPVSTARAKKMERIYNKKKREREQKKRELAKAKRKGIEKT